MGVKKREFIHSFYKHRREKMKTLKRLISATIMCLVVGASGTAWAVDCPNGALVGTTVDEVVINGQSCYIERLIVTGDLIVANSEDLMIWRAEVGGRIRILGGGNAIIVSTTADRITVRNNEYVNLVGNVVRERMRVINNLKANVKKNAASILVCRNNHRLDAFENEAAENRCRALGGGLFGPGGPGDGF
jgi:hypothetical protein